MGRLVIVSNRLPVTISEKKGILNVRPSTGGLATGLNSLSNKYEVIWVGWPGLAGNKPGHKTAIRKILKGLAMFPVFIDSSKFNNFYGGFSNSTLWPLFHYFQQFTEFVSRTWNDYADVNELFADHVAKIAKADDIFWVQDYQLMLVPQMLRDRFPNAIIGYFHHIPFPSYELMRTLPWRDSLMRGVLGADLVGFHTYDYVRHFASATTRILNYDDQYLGRIRFKNRVVDIDSFPMGIDYDKFANAVNDPATIKEIERYRKEIKDEKIILNIDRLDYSKALPQRLRAFDLFLTKYPNYRRKVSMLVILVPSRDNVGRYKQLKEEIDRIVGYINSKYGRINWTPIHYYYRSIKFTRMIAWYKLAPVALITPYRDGMNLVSKEYLACKDDGKGVLILSEMAGSSKELIGALMVNPNNTEDIADSLHQAFQMPEEEQIERVRKMQKVLQRNNVNYWSEHFLERLHEVHKASLVIHERYFDPKIEKRLITSYKKAKTRLLFLDYDGTMANFRSDPLTASPTKELYNTLDILSSNPANNIVLISGRDKEILSKWFGKYPIDLVAEHGAWYKKGNKRWQQFAKLDVLWKDDIRPVFNQFTDRTPGSFLEEKNYSLAWHYRKTDPGLAEMRKHEFMEKLGNKIYGENLQIMEGNKVLEVKNLEVNKGIAAKKWLNDKNWEFIMAIGDDYTDEDTFKAMPDAAFTIKVGFNETAAKSNITGVEDVHILLGKLVKVS
jgi:trehalose 6-phosphate synthase/phosphatase